MAGTITHQWNGTILTITSDSGTSSCDLKGEKGDDGARGAMGLPGDANLIDAVAAAEKAAADAETALSQLGTARDEAVAAAAQVKQIVAGNEAYTKAESDNRFAAIITPTVKENIVSIKDAAAYPTVAAITHIEPKQEGSGEASPANIRPISGWNAASIQRTGKNLIPYKYKANTAMGVSGNTVIEYTLSGTYLVSDIYLKAGTYTLTGATTVYIYVYDKNKNVNWTHTRAAGTAAPYIFTLTTDTYVAISGSETTKETLQLEVGTIATAYEPYNGQTLTATLPETIYGGTLDWNTGVLIKDAVLDGTTISTNGHQDAYDDAEHAVFSFTLPRCEHKEKPNIICSHFPYASHPQNHGGKECCGFNPNEIYSEYFYIIIKKSRLSSVSPEGMNAWLKAQTNFKMVYTPETGQQTIQLTPQQLETLKGVNNVWSDSGETTLTYAADTQLYIDNKFNELSTALVAMGG